MLYLTLTHNEYLSIHGPGFSSRRFACNRIKFHVTSVGQGLSFRTLWQKDCFDMHWDATNNVHDMWSFDGIKPGLFCSCYGCSLSVVLMWCLRYKENAWLEQSHTPVKDITEPLQPILASLTMIFSKIQEAHTKVSL